MTQQKEKTYTEDELTNIIFSSYPKDPNSIEFIAYHDNMDTDKVSFIFEILINIYMKAILNSKNLFSILSKHFGNDEESDTTDKINVYSIEKINLDLPEPWFKSFGYFVLVNEYDPDDFNDNYKHNYCKILLRDNPLDKSIYIFRNIKEPFHFILNSKYKKFIDIQSIFLV